MLWVTGVSSLQHPLQGDLPLSDHLLLPLLGVPALDGSSKLWRYQGESGSFCPLRGGKRWDRLRAWGGVLRTELGGEALAGHEE